MRYLKKFKIFLEDGTANASTSAGMGDVVSAQPGNVPGTFGTSGSGDIGFTFKKEKRKKGNPSQVSDLRDLKDIKTNRVDESIDDQLSKEDNQTIKDCLSELTDVGFNIYELDVFNQNDTDQTGHISISLSKEIENYFSGSLNIRYYFNKKEIYDKKIFSKRSITYSSSKAAIGAIINGEKLVDSLTTEELSLLTSIDDVSHQLINQLGYTLGMFTIGFSNNGSRYSMIHIYISINKEKNSTNEGYSSKEEFISDVVGEFKKWNIRPVELNKLIEFYDDEMTKDFEDGQYPKYFVDKKVKEWELDSGGFMAQKIIAGGPNGTSPLNRTIKYL